MPNKILVVAAHADDETLGCGGTIAKHIDSGDEVIVMFMTDGVSSRKINKESTKVRLSSSEKAMAKLGVKSIVQCDFPDNKMDSVPLLEVVKEVEKVISALEPNIVYTHFSHDLNIDHRVTHYAVMTACRPQSWSSVKQIYTFEVLSSTEWNSIGEEKFNPNKFVDVSPFWCKKVDALLAYKDELREFPHSRSLETIEALAVLRGATMGLTKAEAFQVERIIG